MTSQQLKAKLDAAIAVIRRCEMALADPEKAVRKGYLDEAIRAVFNFMDRHRDDERQGGQP